MSVEPDRAKVRMLITIPALVIAVDYATKQAVLRTFRLHESIEVVGDLVRLTYIRNPGAAFGIGLGPHSRWWFTGLALAAICVLMAMYVFTPARERVRLAAIALVAGGALGNLIDRFGSSHGVVDFVDVGLGEFRWPVFNVADMAVTTGAVVLALSLWREDRRVDGSG